MKIKVKSKDWVETSFPVFIGNRPDNTLSIKHLDWLKWGKIIKVIKNAINK
jgi:hypothetical protein